MLLVNYAQTSGALEIRVNDHDFLLVLLLAGLIEDGADSLAKLDPACSLFLGAALELRRVDCRLDSAENVGALWVADVEISNGRFARVRDWSRCVLTP